MGTSPSDVCGDPCGGWRGRRACRHAGRHFLYATLLSPCVEALGLSYFSSCSEWTLRSTRNPPSLWGFPGTHPRSGSPNSQELGEPCFLGFCRFCDRITSANTSCHRSHFGSRYTLGCCGHAGLFSLCRISPGLRAFSCACLGFSPRVQGRLPRGKWKS